MSKKRPFDFLRKSKESTKKTVISSMNPKKFLVKALGFIEKQGESRENFSYSEFDLNEIRIASLSDSYIKTALSKYTNLMYKAGYTLKSDNEQATEYIEKRFKIMSYATGNPMDILWQEMSDDLIKYSNSFLIKSRVDKIMPGIKAIGVLHKKPVGGYFRVSPDTMQIKRDDFGKILKYKQIVNGKEQEYKVEDVVHFYLDKDANNAFGTPRIQAALEDVKLLRRIEGNVISLIYRFSIPIYQWIIGLPKAGFQASDTEIKEAEYEIEKMPLDGVIVTNEKTQIKAIGAEGHALDASKYLEYFEKRVFTALDVSASQMGRGGSKQDADSMEAQTHDTIKHIQRTLAIFIENTIINELLLEGGFNPILNKKDEVKYVFQEISLDTKVKVENHELLKYQSNLITFEEARQSIGKKVDVDRSGLYVDMIETYSNEKDDESKTRNAIKIAKINNKLNSENENTESDVNQNNEKSNGLKGNGTKVSKKPNKQADTLNRPKNQHGTTSVKIKEVLNENGKVNLDKKSHKDYYDLIYKNYNNIKYDVINNDEDIDLLFPIGKDLLKKHIIHYVYDSSLEGINDAVRDFNKARKVYNTIPNLDLDLNEFYKDIDVTLITLFKDIKNDILKNESVEETFEKYSYRIRYMIEHILPKTYWFSYIKCGYKLGVKQAEIIFNKDSKDKEMKNSIINTKAFSIDDIPSYHPFCQCKVKFIYKE